MLAALDVDQRTSVGALPSQAHPFVEPGPMEARSDVEDAIVGVLAIGRAKALRVPVPLAGGDQSAGRRAVLLVHSEVGIRAQDVPDPMPSTPIDLGGDALGAVELELPVEPSLAPVAEGASEGAPTVRLHDRLKLETGMAFDALLVEPRPVGRSVDVEVFDPGSLAGVRHEGPIRAPPRDAGDAVEATGLEVALQNVHEGVLALAASTDVDEGVLVHEGLGPVRNGGAPEDDETLGMPRLDLARDGQAQVEVPHVRRKGGDGGFSYWARMRSGRSRWNR